MYIWYVSLYIVARLHIDGCIPLRGTRIFTFYQAQQQDDFFESF